MLVKISQVINRTQSDITGLPDELSIDDITLFIKFAQITSVDVERSFSYYKNC